MNPISLISNHNPKNQLNLPSFQPLQPQSNSSPQNLQTINVKLQQNYENKDAQFYEQQIKKLAYMNTIITAQLASALEERKIVMRLISDAQKREKSVEKNEIDKRFRRCAKDIQRKFNCPEKDCEKSYGTQGSLLQHIKLKHPKINSHDPPLLLDPF